MKHPQLFVIALLPSLVSLGCDSEPEPEVVFDMGLLDQNEEGEWFAPIPQDGPGDLVSSGSDDQSSAYGVTVHNHLVHANWATGHSYWVIHRDGGHGNLCGPWSAYTTHCSNISSYLGGTGWKVTSWVDCPAAGATSMNCTVW